jgi:carbon monoxide dehydrogenase subunit G
MQTKLDRVFPIDASADVAWRLLEDIKSVAGCIPGAEITERVDTNHYKGNLRVKLGPVSAAFAGTIEITATDPALRKIHLMGKGTDTKGGSAASMDLAAEVRNVDASKCELVGHAEVTLTGKLASFGGRMINQVSDQILKQFAENFASMAQSTSGASTSGSVGAPAPVAARELNLLALVWNIIRDFFRRLFGRREKTGTPS